MISEEKDNSKTEVLLENLMSYTQNDWNQIIECVNKEASK